MLFLNYYLLSKEKRDQKYKMSVLQESETLVLESGVDPEQAIEFAYKVCVMESLITRINFSDVVRHKIEEIISSDVDNKLFEENELGDLWSDFKVKANKLSKIIATSV